jgi:hypothetical protein
VRLLVVDPALLLEAFLVPEGNARRLLNLLAYGREANFPRLYSGPESSERRGSVDVAVRVGGPSYEEIVADGDDLLEEMAAALPPEAPDDLGLVISEPLLSELDQTMDNLRGRIPGAEIDGLGIRLAVLARAARVLLGDDAREEGPWWWAGNPDEETPARRHLLDAAAHADAYAVISDDPALARSPGTPSPFENMSIRRTVAVLPLDLFVRRDLKRLKMDAVRSELLGPGHGRTPS